MPAAQPPIHVDLNAIFVTSIGIGYLLPLRDPVRYRAYLWIFGVGLKTAGAAAFLADYWLRASPASFLLFAASDALVAGLTFAALRLVAGANHKYSGMPDSDHEQAQARHDADCV